MKKIAILFIFILSFWISYTSADTETSKLLIENHDKISERINLIENKIDIVWKDLDGLSDVTYNKGFTLFCALAFIFAIQEHDPASFIIMDEVDAALDKKNAEKLAELEYYKDMINNKGKKGKKFKNSLFFYN